MYSDEEILERFFPQYAAEREPDIDEQIKELENRRILAEKEYESSEKTEADRKKLDYICLAVAENKNRLLEKKLIKAEVETSEYRSAYYDLLESTRFKSAERLFLFLLCGYATTIFLPVPESLIVFVGHIVASVFFAFVAALICTMLFPKERSRFWLPGYEKHPHLYSVLFFIIAAGIITIIKIIKQ